MGGLLFWIINLHFIVIARVIQFTAIHSNGRDLFPGQPFHPGKKRDIFLFKIFFTIPVVNAGCGINWILRVSKQEHGPAL
jgi:hypothetical protein